MAAYGFRQRDLSGNVLVEYTTRLTRKIGEVAITAGTSGSVTVPAVGSNAISFYFVADTTDTYYQVMPVFSISGNVISWSSPAPASHNIVKPAGGVLTYGRY